MSSPRRFCAFRSGTLERACVRGMASTTSGKALIGPYVLRYSSPSTQPEILFDDGALTGDIFDVTGELIWPASVAMCRWLEQNRQCVARRRLLELGAGTGLPSILCALHLGAAHVVATDANADAVDRLARALECGGAQNATALPLDWDSPQAVIDVVISERIDTVVLSDVAYPAKDSSLLVSALEALLTLTPEPVRQPLTVWAALTCRDPLIFHALEAALHALPGHVKQFRIDTECDVDPLYGVSPIHMFELRPSSSLPRAASSSTWRLAVARWRLWPDERPEVPRVMHGWLHRGNERLLRRLIAERQPRAIVELGSWLGLSTSLLLQASQDWSAAVFAVDQWNVMPTAPTSSTHVHANAESTPYGWPR